MKSVLLKTILNKTLFLSIKVTVISCYFIESCFYCVNYVIINLTFKNKGVLFMIFTESIDISLLATNFVGVLALTYLIILVISNRVFDVKRKRNYILAAIFVILMILFEAFDYILYAHIFVEEYATPQFISAVAITRYVIAFLEYSLAPFIPFFLICVVGGYKKNYSWTSILLSFGACVGNIFYPYIYDVNEQAEFTHGPLYLIPTIICLGTIFILILMSFKTYQTLRRQEKTAIILMMLGIIASSFLQYYVFVGSFLIWNVTAIFLVLYYLIVHIQMYLLDPLTGLYNRSTWENDMQEIEGRSDATLIMLDLNNLKRINDIRGHAEGDKAISRVAHIIRLSLGRVGKCYRIGGDEFAVISKAEDARVEQARLLLDKYIAQQEYTVAYGSIKYDHTCDETIKTVFKKADKIMYEHKASIKKSLSLRD